MTSRRPDFGKLAALDASVRERLAAEAVAVLQADEPVEPTGVGVDQDQQRPAAVSTSQLHKNGQSRPRRTLDGLVAELLTADRWRPTVNAALDAFGRDPQYAERIAANAADLARRREQAARTSAARAAGKRAARAVREQAAS